MCGGAVRSSSNGLAGMHPELERLARRGDPEAKQFLKALQIFKADVRQRKSHWQAADSTAGFTILDDGVRLAETVQTLIPERAPHNAYFTDLDLDGRFPFMAATVEWAGTEPDHVEIKRVKAWLHPRSNPGVAQTAYWWKLELFRLVKVGATLGIPSKRQLFLAPLCDPIKVLVQGSSEGLVTFDYSTAPVQDRPKPKRYGLPQFTTLLSPVFNAAPAPVTLLVITALDKTGAPATNVGFGYDNTVASVATNGNVLSSRKLEAPPRLPLISDPLQLVGTHSDGGAGGGTPRLVIEYGTYVSAKLTFSGGGNQIDLGHVPDAANDVVFTIIGAVPFGTQLTGQVLKDGGNPVLDADWRTFLSGQKTDDLANVSKRQQYQVRGSFVTDASAALTPTMRKIAVEEVKTNNCYDQAGNAIARLQLAGGEGVDLVTLQGEIVRGMVTGILDGDRDYKSFIEQLLGAANLRDYTFRVYCGAISLSEDKWLHLNDYLPEGQFPRAADYAIPIISPLVLVRGLLPKKSPGSSYGPDGDLAVGTYTTETGAGAPLFSHINEADADDLTYIQSALDPVNQIYKSTLPTPADLPGRRLYLDYRIQKDVAGGKTIDATIELRQAGALISTTGLLANISDALTPGSIQLSDASIAAITDPPNLELWITFNVGGAGGSRRGRLTWWRFRTEDRRVGVAYVNQSVKAVYDDLIANQLGIDARFRGPGLEDTTTLVTKAISEITAEETPTSKEELDAVAYVVGYANILSQGRLKAVNMNDPGEVRAVWPMEEIRILAITQGIEDRIDNPVVPFNWNPIKAEFDDEWEGASAAGILAYWGTKLDQWRLPQEVGKWIAPQPIPDYAVLARSVGTRMLDWFGTGRGRAVIETAYPFPELEAGDTVVFEQDQLVIRDPFTGEDRRGRIWLTGKIELPEDPDPAMNRRFTVAIRPLYDVFSLGSASGRDTFVAPVVRSVQLHVDDGGNVLANISVQGAKAIRIAASKVGVPSDATTRAAALQLVDANAQLTTATLLSIIPGEVLSAKVFAYEKADGSGAESFPVSAATPKGTRKRAFVFDDGLFPLRATENDGTTKTSSAHNPQGSILPAVVPGIINYRTTNAGGACNIGLTWSSTPITLPDGSTLSLPAPITPGGAGAPAAPALSDGGVGGALAAATYWVRIAYVRHGWIMAISNESSQVLALNHKLTIGVVADPGVGGYDGWIYLISTGSGTEVVTNSAFPTNGNFLSFGSGVTISALGGTISDTYNNMTNTGQAYVIRVTGLTSSLAPSTTYFAYPFYDAVSALVDLPNAHNVTLPIAADATSAQIQYADQHFPLSLGGLFGGITTLASPGSSSGLGGGGRNFK